MCVSTATGDNEDNLFNKPLNYAAYNRIRFVLGWTYLKLSRLAECDHYSGRRCTAISSVRLFSMYVTNGVLKAVSFI